MAVSFLIQGVGGIEAVTHGLTDAAGGCYGTADDTNVFEAVLNPLDFLIIGADT